MFGVKSIRLEKRIDLVVSLKEWSPDVVEERTGLVLVGEHDIHALAQLGEDLVEVGGRAAEATGSDALAADHVEELHLGLTGEHRTQLG